MKKTFLLISLIIAGLLAVSCENNTNTGRGNANRTSNSNYNSNVSNNMTNNSSNTNSSNSMMNNSSNINSANVNSNNVAVVEDSFWVEAAQGGMAEVELGKLALQKSQNAEVKKFAQKMVADHGKANAELKTLAAKNKVKLPTEVSSSHKSKLDDLSKLSGAEFDKRYVDEMVSDHEHDVDLFDDHTNSSNADIKAFTTKTLPTLKSHLEMIKEIQGKMK